MSIGIYVRYIIIDIGRNLYFKRYYYDDCCCGFIRYEMIRYKLGLLYLLLLLRIR